MEIAIISGLIGAGYYLNKDGIKRSRIEDDNKNSFLKNKNKEYLSKDDMNGDNIYESEKSYTIRQCEQASANKLWSKVGDLATSNVVIPGPPDPILNKIDYEDKRLPIEFNNNPPKIQQLNTKPVIYDTNDLSYLENVATLDAGGFDKTLIKGQPLNKNTYMSLSGTEMTKEEFYT